MLMIKSVVLFLKALFDVILWHFAYIHLISKTKHANICEIPTCGLKVSLRNFPTTPAGIATRVILLPLFGEVIAV